MVNRRLPEPSNNGKIASLTGLANSVPQLPSSSNVSVVNNGVSSDTDSEVGLLEVLEGVVSSNKGGDALPKQLKAVDAVEVGATNTHAVSSSINTSENLADALRAGFTPAENVHNPDIVPKETFLSKSKESPAPDPPDSDLGIKKQFDGVDENRALSKSALKRLRKQARSSLLVP